MWGSQGWNQWALQPAMFNDVPHEQIDWAALAKQWIQMQQTQPDPAAAATIPPVPPPVPSTTAPSIMPPLPPGHGPGAPEDFTADVSLKPPIPSAGMPEQFHVDRPFEVDQGFVPKPPSNFWNKPQWEVSATSDVDDRIWPSPAIEPAANLIAGKETYDYGHMHDNAPLAMQSIDYNHMSEFSYNQVYPDTQYEQYWSQVNAAPPITPMFLKKEHTSSSSKTTTSSHPAEEETVQIDAAKRKHLPAWIREGLEKMEQERVKKLEKERAEKEKAEKLVQAKLKSDLNFKDDSSLLTPAKSKFDSDSDSEEANIIPKKQNVAPKRSPSPIEDTRTEEEKRQEYMLNIRRILTEILLTVTNAEMYAVAEEVLKKERLKARQLASTASLTSVASGLCSLANYGTESEASEVEEDKEATDSEEELHRRIKEKKKLFAIKEKKIIAELERKEIEEQNEASQTKNENVKPMEVKFEETESNVKKIESANSSIDAIQKSFLPPSDALDQVCVIPFIQDKADVVVNSDNATSNRDLKKSNDKNSGLANSSASSNSEGESGDKKKSNDNDGKNSDRSKGHKKDKSPKKQRRHRSSDSDSSDQTRKSRSRDKASKKSSTYKKKKKYKRSDSSSSSSSASHRRKYSSKSEPSHRDRRSRSRSYNDRDRKRRRSNSPRSYRSSRDSHRSKNSYSHRHERDKYSKRDREDRRYNDSKRSPSPYRKLSKLPKKYRSSRSPSSGSESSRRKSKKYRTH